MKILKSLEEALYEVMVWLVFYPLTLWRVLTRPAQMMAYADSELDDEEGDRYSDKLSPPIFLALTLALTHAAELATGTAEKQTGLLASEDNLLAFRLIVFSTYPLVLAVRLLRAKGIRLDRKTLRPPFYAQCYVAAPWAVVVSVAPIVAFSARGATLEGLAVALGLIGLAAIWYLTLQARWFARSLGRGIGSGARNALGTFVVATVAVIALSAAVEAF